MTVHAVHAAASSDDLPVRCQHVFAVQRPRISLSSVQCAAWSPPWRGTSSGRILPLRRVTCMSTQLRHHQFAHVACEAGVSGPQTTCLKTDPIWYLFVAMPESHRFPRELVDCRYSSHQAPEITGARHDTNAWLTEGILVQVDSRGFFGACCKGSRWPVDVVGCRTS